MTPALFRGGLLTAGVLIFAGCATNTRRYEKQQAEASEQVVEPARPSEFELPELWNVMPRSVKWNQSMPEAAKIASRQRAPPMDSSLLSPFAPRVLSFPASSSHWAWVYPSARANLRSSSSESLGFSVRAGSSLASRPHEAQQP